MKGFLTTILSACLLFASVRGTADMLSARAESRTNPTAQPEIQSSESDSLILPSSYEQYLPLDAPTGVAVCRNYTAVSDGNVIYVYDRADGEYRLYRHEENRSVTNLQFSADGLLYFSDAALGLYTLDPETLAPTRTEILCSSFALFSENGKDALWYSTVSGGQVQIYKNGLSQPLVKESTSTSLALACDDNGTLYYTNPSGNMLYQAGKQPGEETPYAKLPHKNGNAPVQALVFSGNTVCYTDDNGIFYAYPVSALRDLQTDDVTPQYVEAGGYSSLAMFDGYVYAVKNNKVRQYHPETQAFTDYEICAASDSPNRLSGATGLSLCGELLLSADTGNSRISVYNRATDAFRVISCAFPPLFLASDGKTALAANQTSAALYDLQNGEQKHTFSDFNGNLTGIACVYGTYYFLTEANVFCRLAQDGTIETAAKSSVLTPSLLSQDIYGSLYVGYSDGSLRRFTESEFMNPENGGEEVCRLPIRTKKIAIGYDLTVYALCENKLYTCTDVHIPHSFDTSFVFSDPEKREIDSFALDPEKGGIYLLIDGNFIAETHTLPIATVGRIPVENSDEKIFSKENAEFSVVRTKPDSVFVYFDIAALSGAEYFPYLRFDREAESKTALQLGETEQYDLIAVFDEQNKTYSTALVLKAYCEELARNDYLKPAEGFENGIGYLTNTVALYKYPYLTELLTVCSLPKGGAVTVLGEIDRLDYRYYYVSFTDETGTERKGYIPKAYLTEFNGAPPQPEELTYGGDHTDWDSVWRMAFLLLGCASVCVLLDYMILRKKKD